MNKPLFTWRTGLLLALLLTCSALRAQNINWNVVASGTQYATTTDATGGVWVATDGYCLTYEGVANFYSRGFSLTKYNASGVVEWTKPAKTGSPSVPLQLKADGLGNVYVLGNPGKPVQASFTVTGNTTTARLAAGDPEEALLKVYPNPVTGKLHLQLAETAEPLHGQLYDPLGRLHYQGRLQPADGNQVLDLTGLPAGLYVVRAESGGKTYRVKIRKE